MVQHDPSKGNRCGTAWSIAAGLRNDDERGHSMRQAFIAGGFTTVQIPNSGELYHGHRVTSYQFMLVRDPKNPTTYPTTLTGPKGFLTKITVRTRTRQSQ